MCLPLINIPQTVVKTVLFSCCECFCQPGAFDKTEGECMWSWTALRRPFWRLYHWRALHCLPKHRVVFVERCSRNNTLMKIIRGRKHFRYSQIILLYPATVSDFTGFPKSWKKFSLVYRSCNKSKDMCMLWLWCMENTAWIKTSLNLQQCDENLYR